MSKASIFVLAAAIAIPASAADPAASEPTLDPGRAVVALAAIPAAPIVSTAEGASDASGGSRILTSALWGGLAGAAIGAGVGLIEGGNYGRDIAIGAGVGILIGGALGAANAFGDTRTPYADGMRSPDRDPVITARTVGLAGRF